MTDLEPAPVETPTAATTRARKYCCKDVDPRRGSLGVAVFTMVYMIFVSALIAYHINRLLLLEKYTGFRLTGTYVEWPEDFVGLKNASISELNDFLQRLDSRKIIYTGLLCLCLILAVISCIMFNAITQKHIMVFVGWMAFLAANIIYGGAVVAAEGSDSKYRFVLENEIRMVLFFTFMVIEVVNVRYVFLHFRNIQRALPNMQRHYIAVFDPRHADDTIFTIADSVGGARAGAAARRAHRLACKPDPRIVFVLPTYVEALESGGGSCDPPLVDDASTVGEPPPYQPCGDPPPYIDQDHS